MIKQNLQKLKENIPTHVSLVAVSKTKPISAIQEAYDAGQRDFGENKIQEMASKHEDLPKDIRWHMIGHVQTNKVKYMASFVHLIHGVDSLKLLKEINKQAKKHDRVINCLLQARIAVEETKFGMPFSEIKALLNSDELLELQNIKIVGLMGMASFTSDKEQVINEFSLLSKHFKTLKTFNFTNFQLSTLSMGMSADYKLAIEQGSTMIRVGSAIFGLRNYIS
ncbi:MAG TPA: YggS family pyridoxal phosphate-dependent enzyme [Lutibacter sp.]|nr:YggS family pyridoxal phosphate-dependent enzyme [Lutibacter sp.]